MLPSGAHFKKSPCRAAERLHGEKGSVLFLFVRVFAAAVAGSAVAAAALAFPAAVFGDPDNGQRKQCRQNHNGNDPTKCQHFSNLFSEPEWSASSIHDFAPESNREAAGKRSEIF